MTEKEDISPREMATIGLQVDGEVEKWEFAMDPTALSDQELVDEMSQFEDLIEKAYANKTPRTAMDQKSAMTYMRQHTQHTAELARRTLSGSESDTDDSQTTYVVVDPVPTDSDNRPHFSYDSIIGVYDTKEQAETAAESHGEYHYATEMEVGRVYPGVYIYEAPLNGGGPS